MPPDDRIDPGVSSRIGRLSPERRELLNRLLLEKRGERAAPQTIPRRDCAVDAALSYGQQRLWILDRLLPGSPAYNETFAVPLPGAVNPPLVERVLNEIVRRHDILRTTIREDPGGPVQAVAAMLHVPLPIVDLRHVDETRRQAEVSRLAAEDAHRPFDLTTGPLVRATLLRVRDSDHILLLTMHHIVCDGWSLGVLALEFTLLYRAFESGRPSPLPELAVQYADFSVWQRRALTGETLKGQLAYWKSQLAGLARLQLPADRMRPTMPTFAGAHQPLTIQQPLHQALKRLGKAEDATLFMTLLSVFLVFLHRYSGQTDLAVGAPIVGRNRKELEGLIGFFVNTLVLRTDVSGDPTFRQLLRRVRDVTLAAYANQDVPFEMLVSEVLTGRDLGVNPFFQTVFQLFATPGAPGVRTEEIPPVHWVDTGLSKFDLRLSLLEAAGKLTGFLEYSTDLFDRATAARMADQFHTLLNEIVADPDQPIGAVPLMTTAERERMLVLATGPRTAYPRDRTVAELVAEQAAHAPDAVAVSDEGRTVSYAALDRTANQIAHVLRGLGVTPGARVAACLDRSIECVSVLLGVLKAGAVYVPLDPGYPPARLAFMLDDSKAAVVVSTTALRRRLPARGVPVLTLDSDVQVLAAAADTELAHGTSAESLAYIMYTSGSTGQPKGVCIPHRAIVRLVRETNYISFTAADRVAHASSVSFDAATFEIWGALINGARLAIVPKHVALEPDALEACFRHERITVAFLTTDLFHQLAGSRPDLFSSLDTLVVGGAAMDPARARAVLRSRPPRRLVNGYGPTESTTFAACHVVEEVAEDAATVPIGRPIGNTQTYVLDAGFAPVPVGVAGELFIGGDGLAQGYFNRPELTAERFVVHPIDGGHGARLYRTGDRARMRADGTLEFLGRWDDQVKLRGFRVELGEIEATLRQHPAVRQAAVLLREDAPGDKQLVAYVQVVAPDVRAVDGKGARNDVEDLGRFMVVRLPEYMVPGAIVLVDEFPLTSNGKIDRNALPRPPTASALTHRDFLAKATALEKVVYAIWKELFHLDEIDVNRNFFELGGQSLVAMQLVSRLRDVLQIEFSVRTVFESPTLPALCESIVANAVDPVRLEKTAQLLLLVEGFEEDQAVEMLSRVGADASQRGET
jgi:amino acid adenylation domain-containing protein